MKSILRNIFRAVTALVFAVLLLCTCPGCKDTSASTRANPRTGPAYAAAIYAPVVQHGGLLADPLTTGFWRSATWHKLSPALDRTHTDGSTRVAVACRGNTLYTAFLCANTPAWFSPHARPADIWRGDAVEVWLDTSRAHDGTNFMEIVVAPNGRTYECLHRSALPPHPRPDGKINFSWPFSLIPCQIKGLAVWHGRGHVHGHGVWMVVVKVPLAALPHSLRVAAVQPRDGTKFRFNLIRYQWHLRSGKRHLVQQNLFPVATAYQGFAPYRMGELVIGSGEPMNNVALQTH